MMKRSCSSLTNQGDSFELIPFDLIFEILLRVPAKSTTRFRCVSKLWNSTIRSPNFTKSFFPISSSRPKLLFRCPKDGESFFFSVPQPQNSSPIAVTSHMSFPDNYSTDNCRPVRGLVCGLNQQYFKERRRVTVPFICNPSTGESLTLRRVKTRRKKVFSYFGYEPIDKKFKVLCMTESLVIAERGTSQEHQVLTLDFEKKRQPSWRMIKCDLPHTADHLYDPDVYDGICINGVLYYSARVHTPDISGNYTNDDIVSFDFKSEKFSCIRKDHGMQKGCSDESVLVNYKGKLAMLQPNCMNQIYKKNIQLWVLEDAEKNQWLSYIYDMSPVVLSVWMSMVRETKLGFVGTADTCEIVLLPRYIKDSFYLVYLNIEKKTLTRVEIRGMEGFKHQKVYAFLDHVEDLKLIANV